MDTRSSWLGLLALGIGACGGATVDDGKTPSPAPTSTSPSIGDPLPPNTNGDPGNDLPQRSVAPVRPVLATSYDQTCTVADDCVPFTETSDCSCACPNAAINKRDAARAQSDLDAHRNACVQNDAPGCGVMCVSGKVACDTEGGLVGACRFIAR